MSQVIENSFNRAKGQKLDPWIGDVFVSILPCWHIFERTAEYWTLARGVTMVYSSLKSFKNDLKRWKPQFIIAVPRLFESIYTGAQQSFAAQTSTKRKLIAAFKALSMLHMKAKRVLTNMVIRPQPPPLMEKILSALLFVLTWPLVRIADKLAWRKVREGLGGKVKVLVSGGSSMPAHIEDFFEMIGEKLIVGYGLTETSPVISNRVAEHNLPGSCGSPPPGTLVKLVDPVTKQEVKKGEPGVIMVKSEGVMTGYMQDEEATRQVINSEGWFDTGDLGRLNPVTGDLIITGRAKDTIVLSNGENVEPQPIEDEILSKSPLIDQVHELWSAVYKLLNLLCR
jgi:long-chain acyl-CoA synthetase